jgi:hypothetical protein
VVPVLRLAVPMLVFAACAADDGNHGDPVTIEAPLAGATIPRNYLRGDGTWVARVPFRAAVTATRAATVEWIEDGQVLGIGARPGFVFTAEYMEDGDHAVTALARDAEGAEVARAERCFHVETPKAAEGDCLEKLDAIGQPYTRGPATPGIDNPVTLTLPVNGLPFTFVGSSAPRDTWLMDCELALAVWRMADLLKEGGVAAVTDYGIYNYRCVDAAESPPCPTSGLSIHALGLAIDVAGLTTSDGARYSVATDWVVDSLPSDGNTCTVTPAEGENNQTLHALLCQLYAASVFHVLLTPNYNADHRNHWHLDIGPAAEIIVW